MMTNNLSSAGDNGNINPTANPNGSNGNQAVLLHGKQEDLINHSILNGSAARGGDQMTVPTYNSYGKLSSLKYS